MQAWKSYGMQIGVVLTAVMALALLGAWASGWLREAIDFSHPGHVPGHAQQALMALGAALVLGLRAVGSVDRTVG